MPSISATSGTVATLGSAAAAFSAAAGRSLILTASSLSQHRSPDNSLILGLPRCLLHGEQVGVGVDAEDRPIALASMTGLGRRTDDRRCDPVQARPALLSTERYEVPRARVSSGQILYQTEAACGEKGP